MPLTSPDDDPAAGWLALRRIRRIAEAARCSELLQSLIRRAGLAEEVDIAPVVSRLSDLERSHLMREYGPIPPRSRFRRPAGSGNPMRDERPVRELYADESGVPKVTSADDAFACFAIGAVAISADEADRYRQRADRLKQDFGLVGRVFHEPKMSRHEDSFYFGGDRQRQREFDLAVDQLIAETDCTAFAVGVRKRAYERDYVEPGTDPFLPLELYELAVHLLLERIVDYLANDNGYPLGKMTFEARGPREDAELQRAVAEVLVDGTRWVSNRGFQRYLRPGVDFTPKRGSSPLEISDTVARSVYDWVTSGCEREPRRWPLLGEKWYRHGDLKMGKFGLKVFPDSDLTTQIEAHRDQFRAK